jgi:hypothetical protein
MGQRPSRVCCAALVPLAISACLGGILFGSPALAQGEGTGEPKQNKTGEVILSFDKTGKFKISPSTAPLPRATSPKPITGVLPRTIEKPDPDCGVHALYILLRLRGMDCALDQLRKRLTLTQEGASMLDLKAAAAEWGVPTAVVTLSAEQLEPAVPFIARMKTPNAKTEGHYVVVTQVTNDRVTVLDSTAGGVITSPRPMFEGEFSGYTLIPVEVASPWRWVRVVLGIVCVVELGLAAFFMFSRKRPDLAPATGAMGTGV